MPRIRSIKPELFVSPQVMNLSRDARLLFIGLITQADDEGRGTADPRKLKAAIFGGDDDLTLSDILELLADIEKNNLCITYEENGHGRIYALPSFREHQYIQRPKRSVYPKPPKQALRRVARNPIASRNDIGSVSDEADPGIGGSDRILGSDRIGSEGSDRIPARAREGPSEFTDEQLQFARIRAAYPDFSGRHDWTSAEHYCHLRIERDGMTWEGLHSAAERYAVYCAAGGVSGPQYVLTPAKFFSAPDKPWLQSWAPPPNKAEQRLSGNIAAAAEAERRIFGEAK